MTVVFPEHPGLFGIFRIIPIIAVIIMLVIIVIAFLGEVVIVDDCTQDVGLGIAEKIDRPGDDLFAGLAPFDDQADAVYYAGRQYAIRDLPLAGMENTQISQIGLCCC